MIFNKNDILNYRKLPQIRSSIDMLSIQHRKSIDKALMR